MLREAASAPPSSLTIARIETVPIRVPLARTYRGSGYQMTHRSTVITRVHTEQGPVGEAYAGDEDATLLEIDRIIREEIAPLLQGEDALAIERCWELTRPATFDILRDRRLGLVACAAVDTALWDAVGKALGQPLWRLWGGYRRSLPMIAIGGYYNTGISIEEEIEALARHGPRGTQVQGRRASARGGRGSLSAGPAGGGPPVPARRGREPGLDARGGDSVRQARGGLRSRLVRGAVPVGERPASDA